MAHRPPQQPIDTRNFRTSWRLTFHFDGAQVTLVGQERVQKVAAGTTPDRPRPGENSGSWLELVDTSGGPLFHRLLGDPLRTRAEHHSPDGRIELHLRAPDPCDFVAVVPDIPEASDVVLYASPTEPERIAEAAREVARFPLRERGSGEGPHGPERQGGGTA